MKIVSFSLKTTFKNKNIDHKLPEIFEYYISGKEFIRKINENLSSYYKREIMPANKEVGQILHWRHE